MAKPLMSIFSKQINSFAMLSSILTLVLMAIWSCIPKGNEGISSGLAIHAEMEYAEGFSMQSYDQFTLIEVYHPWDDYRRLASYLLHEKGADLPDSLTEVDFIVEVPVNRMAVYSSTYLGMLAELDAFDVVSGSTDPQMIYHNKFRTKIAEGSLADLGKSMQIDAESLIAHNPDLVMKYIYQVVDAADPKIISAGIPIAYNIEFMEDHPLGRAEWIKFIGAFIGKKEEADSVFNLICSEYDYYKTMASQASIKPKVLDGSLYKGTWYAAGGNSFMAQFFADANSDYYWQNDSSRGGLPLSLEDVLLHQQDADIWINCNATSLKELEQTDSRSAAFKAFQNGKVYHYNKRVNEHGGADYFESGVARPDLLLRDLCLVIHPQLFEPKEETYYWKQLD